MKLITGNDQLKRVLEPSYENSGVRQTLSSRQGCHGQQ